MDKKNKMSYEKFKREVWPFLWEENKKESSIEGTMDIDQWQELLNKPIKGENEILPTDNLKL